MEKSRVHTELLKIARNLKDITVHALYENYPEFDIDAGQEKTMLVNYDIIIWQHPFYWYSAPAIIKQWQDIVLKHVVNRLDLQDILQYAVQYKNMLTALNNDIFPEVEIRSHPLMTGLFPITSTKV